MKSLNETMIGVTVVVSAALLSVVVVFASLRLEMRARGAGEIERYSPPVEDTVAGLSTNVWVVRFSGLRPARLHVSAAGRITCLIYGPAGSRVPGRSLESCERSWTPERTGAYRVEVHNPRRASTPYKLWVSAEHDVLGRCAQTGRCASCPGCSPSLPPSRMW